MHTEMQAVPGLRSGYAPNDSPESGNFIQLVAISDNSNVIIVGYVPAGLQCNLTIKITISLPQITTTGSGNVLFHMLYKHEMLNETCVQ
jgi:hypothetical protein